MSTTDEAAGVFDAIGHVETAHDPVEPVNTEPVAEGADSTADADNTNTQQTQTTETVETQQTGEAESQSQTQATTTETVEPSKTETQTPDAELDNWKATLPPPPVGYQGPAPEVDPDTGQITNMTPEQYDRYMRETIKAEVRADMYTQMVENHSFNVAEQILPEMKNNLAIRELVKNIRVASIMSGQVIDNVEAAKQVREALGLAPAKLAAAQAQGAQNAKASITVQRNAALETGSSQTSPDTSKVDNIAKRIKRGDDEAFVELLDIWSEAGKL